MEPAIDMSSIANLSCSANSDFSLPLARPRPKPTQWLQDLNRLLAWQTKKVNNFGHEKCEFTGPCLNTGKWKSSWWFQLQPNVKNYNIKLDHETPGIRDENSKNISVATNQKVQFCFPPSLFSDLLFKGWDHTLGEAGVWPWKTKGNHHRRKNAEKSRGYGSFPGG